MVPIHKIPVYRPKDYAEAERLSSELRDSGVTMVMSFPSRFVSDKSDDEVLAELECCRREGHGCCEIAEKTQAIMVFPDDAEPADGGIFAGWAEPGCVAVESKKIAFLRGRRGAGE